MNFDTFDAAYIERLRSGDEAAEEHFVRYFSELIVLKLRSRLRSPQAIEDVRQETFVRTLALLRSEKGIRDANRLGALVNSICNNVLFEQYRSDGRSAPLEEETAAPLLEERDKDEVCEEMGVNREYIRVLLHRAKNSFRKAYASEVQA